MSIFTPEEYASLNNKQKLLADASDAIDRGDEANVIEIIKKLSIPPETLMVLKLSAGTEWLEKRGLATNPEAEAKYGKDWLTR